MCAECSGCRVGVRQAERAGWCWRLPLNEMRSAPVAQAEFAPRLPWRATEFDWLTPYAQVLENHGLGDLNEERIG